MIFNAALLNTTMAAVSIRTSISHGYLEHMLHSLIVAALNLLRDTSNLIPEEHFRRSIYNSITFINIFA